MARFLSVAYVLHVLIVHIPPVTIVSLVQYNVQGMRLFSGFVESFFDTYLSVEGVRVYS